MIELVIFDFDGTINDNVSVHYEFHKYLCKEKGIEFPWIVGGQENLENYRNWVSGDWRANAKRIGISYDEAFRLYCDFMKNEGGFIPEKIVQNLIQPRNYKQIILSTNKTSKIKEILEKQGLEKKFEGIFGEDNLIVSKPNSKALIDIIEKENADPNKTIYIGDTVEDIEFARGAGVLSIGVTYGFNSKQKIYDANPDYIAHSSEEVFRILDSEV